jgi:hypothetical protein
MSFRISSRESFANPKSTRFGERRIGSEMEPQQARRRGRAIDYAEGVVLAAILVMVAGMALPFVRLCSAKSAEARARADLARIAAGIRRFMEDVHRPPTRGADGSDDAIYRLVGPGLIPPGAYYCGDDHEGRLAQHLTVDRPSKDPALAYANWKGPYVDPLTPDPWGFAYVVVAYPLGRDDDRDCIVVSAGANGRMDGDYSSPRDVVPVGDDLVEVVVDKSPRRHAPHH